MIPPANPARQARMPRTTDSSTRESVLPSPLPPLVTVRPMVLLSGFLGAGKTTLLRACLSSLATRGRLADVILNDRENPELDCESLRQRAASVSALAGACVCCEGLDQLAELALTAATSRHDLLFVELNGTADPIPVMETFTLMQSRFHMHPRWQVCVIDARNFGNRRRFRDLEELQLETASHFVLSHTAGLDTPALDALRTRIHALNPRASETDAHLLSSQLEHALAANRKHHITANPVANPAAKRPPALAAPHRHDPRHHLAHEFTGCQILLPEPLSSDLLLSWLASLPEDVVRAKALVTTPERPDTRLLFERVANHPCPNPLPVPISDRVPASAILIGADLDPESLLASARQSLNPDCRLG